MQFEINKKMLSRLGRNISLLRNLNRWSLRELGEKTGVSYSAIHKLENAATGSPSYGSLQLIAAALNCEVNDLCNRRVSQVNFDDNGFTVDWLAD